MKSLLTLLLLFSLLATAFAQERRIDKSLIPQRVKSYLESVYPQAKEIQYFKKKEKDSLFYEVEFELNKQDYNLRFGLDGNLLETERQIEFEEIPTSVQRRIKSVLNENFLKVKINKVQEVDPVGKRRYEVYAKVRKSDRLRVGFYKIMFDNEGGLLSMEEDKLLSIESVF